jgi:purine-nucleoside phosphorylase
MSATEEAQRMECAAIWLSDKLGDEYVASIRLGLVLGSGLKSFAEALVNRVEIAFREVPDWPRPKVEGHGASIVFGEIGNVRVACLTGRVHLYEGWQPAEVVRCVRTLRRLGIAKFLLTNAAGGIGDGMVAGDLMVLSDHLNMTGQTPLLGDHEPAFGPRFPDQSQIYSERLRTALLGSGTGLRTGVYAGLLGPSYETPAEVRMLRTLGADAVGMSTVHEAMALNAMGAEVCGMSLITNLAAGISKQPLSHDEVIETGKHAAAAMTGVVGEFCRRLA